MDEFSFPLIARRVAEVYTALAYGRTFDQNVFGSLRQLLDSDSTYRASEQFVQDREYWMNYFAQRPESTRITGRSSGTPENLVRQTVYLSPSRADRLRLAARRARVPWSRIVIAATAVYIHLLTGARDVVVGVPVAARQDPVLERVPGMVSNILPLRLSVRPEVSLSKFIGSVAERVLEILAHQRYRAENLRRDLGLSGNIGTVFGPIINVMSFHYDLHFAGYRSTTHNISLGLLGDLSIIVWDRRDDSGLRIDLRAHPEVCSADELATHQQRLVGLLETIAVADSDRLVGRFNILTTDERVRLVDDNDDNDAAPPVA